MPPENLGKFDSTETEFPKELAGPLLDRPPLSEVVLHRSALLGTSFSGALFSFPPLSLDCSWSSRRRPVQLAPRRAALTRIGHHEKDKSPVGVSVRSPAKRYDYFRLCASRLELITPDVCRLESVRTTRRGLTVRRWKQMDYDPRKTFRKRR